MCRESRAILKLLSFYEPPKSFAVVEHVLWLSKWTDPASANNLHSIRLSKRTPFLYKPAARFAVVKTDSPNFNNPRRRFALAIMDFPNFYKLLHAFRWSIRALRTSASILHALLFSKLTLRTSTFVDPPR